MPRWQEIVAKWPTQDHGMEWRIMEHHDTAWNGIGNQEWNSSGRHAVPFT